MPAQEKPSTVCAVIVNHNAGEHLVAAIDSLRSEGVDQIVVVDNDSTDGSTDAARNRYPEVALHMRPNLGFGAANNYAAARIEADYVWCLNPDAVAHEGALAQLLAVLESDPSVAAVGPLTINPDGTHYPSARSFPVMANAVGHAVLGLWRPDNKWSRSYKRLDADHDHRVEVDWVSGSSMLVRSTAFESVNGFDEGYFMYMEDVDLCWRLRKAGWKIVFEPAALVTHVGGVSTKGRPYKMLKAHHQSALRYNMRTATGWHKALLPLFAIGLAVRLPLAWLSQYRSAK